MKQETSENYRLCLLSLRAAKRPLNRALENLKHLDGPYRKAAMESLNRLIMEVERELDTIQTSFEIEAES